MYPTLEEKARSLVRVLVIPPLPSGLGLSSFDLSSTWKGMKLSFVLSFLGLFPPFLLTVGLFSGRCLQRKSVFIEALGKRP